MIKTFDQYIKGDFRKWLEASKFYLGRAIDPREGGEHEIQFSNGDVMMYHTMTLPELLEFLKATPDVRKWIKENGYSSRSTPKEVIDNYTIRVFDKTADFKGFYDATGKVFSSNPSYQITEIKRGEPYSGETGDYFDVYRTDSRQWAQVSYFDKGLDNEYFIRCHGSENAPKAVEKFAEVVSKKGCAAHFGANFHPGQGIVCGVFYDPEFQAKQSETP